MFLTVSPSLMPFKSEDDKTVEENTHMNISADTLCITIMELVRIQHKGIGQDRSDHPNIIESEKPYESGRIRWRSKWWNRWKGFTFVNKKSTSVDHSPDVPQTHDDDSMYAQEQHHIHPREEGYSIWDCIRRGIDVEEAIKRSTCWMYRRGYAKVVIVICLVYFFLVTIFSALLYLVALGYIRTRNRYCVSGWFENGSVSDNFEVSFELSWTTFSSECHMLHYISMSIIVSKLKAYFDKPSLFLIMFDDTIVAVGYGDPAPSSDAHCFGLRFVCALEAFMGMLYVSFCGAILFAKIVHLNTIANVTFSSVLLIQYGRGIRDHSYGDDDTNTSSFFPKQYNHDDEIQLESSSFKESFPVMEFRIINDHANRPGSEIVDATLTCTVGIIHDNIFTDDVTCGTSEAIPDDSRWRMVKQRLNTLGHQIREKQMSIGQPVRPVVREKGIFKSFIYNLEVEPSNNPLFSRVWYVRHILDENSPLLKPEIRNSIVLNHGHWPHELRDPTSIRNALMEFRQVVVTLSGTSMVTLENVFYAKTYIFEDIFIGWRFAGLYYKADGSISKSRTTGYQDMFDMKVDMNLIHDIVPQLGGGNESLTGKRAELRH